MHKPRISLFSISRADPNRTELLGFSLVDSTAETISIHRMVQAVVRDRLDSDRRKTLAASAVEAINAQFPRTVTTDPGCWETCRVLLPHALAAAEHAKVANTSPEATAGLLNESGVYLRIRAEFLQAKRCHERALKIDEAAYGADHPDVARDVHNLGSLLFAQGDIRGALEHLERALRIFEARLGPDHPKTQQSRKSVENVRKQL